MDCFIGIDLGSTTTKAVLLDCDFNVLGRGITNSRSNYDVAVAVAKQEAYVSTRLTLFRRALGEIEALATRRDDFVAGLELNFRLEQYLDQLAVLKRICFEHGAGERFRDHARELQEILEALFAALETDAVALFQPGVSRKSDFFRDIAGSQYLHVGETLAKDAGLAFDMLLNVYDRSIIEVENHDWRGAEQDQLWRALKRTTGDFPDLDGLEEEIANAATDALHANLNEVYAVGTGYGRARLPFPKEYIRSEILCHGLGAHVMYPQTRTVLDIGGQDTKAIQVDGDGIVTNFQMNDRCAAGCGRYLGYIADEMNIGLHELGPIAMQATKKVRINSTCTVFAGAELRDRLALGEARADILAGLHRAIILRAMSILSRSGGIDDQFTFTGGVAKNEAAVTALDQLVRDNYGDVTINIDPDSIYTGALGAATFARRAGEA